MIGMLESDISPFKRELELELALLSRLWAPFNRLTNQSTDV